MRAVRGCDSRETPKSALSHTRPPIALDIFCHTSLRKISQHVCARHIIRVEARVRNFGCGNLLRIRPAAR